MNHKKMTIGFIFVLAILAIAVIWRLNKNDKTAENNPAVSATSYQTAATTTTSSSAEVPKKKGDIKQIMAQMSVAQKVGQLFFSRVPAENAESDIRQYHLGGYVLFGQETENASKESLQKKIQAFQNASEIPLMIGADEEGGSVSRISNNQNIVSQPFASPQELYQKGGWDQIVTDTKNKAEILNEIGINTGLFPVADVATDKQSFIYERTLGMDAKKTSSYVEKVVTTLKEANSGSTLKHFPGYGNNRDSHLEIVKDERPLAQLRKNDFLPFEAGIKAGADSILVSHNIVTSIDSEVPASISPAIHQLLRKELDFKGVIMTDDMDMAGLADFISQEEAGLAALKAGNDLVMSSSYQTQIPYVIQAVEDGDYSEEELDRSVKRVLVWKEELGLLKE